MIGKPTYEKLEERIRELEKVNSKYKQSAKKLHECQKRLSFLTEQTLLSILILQDGKIVYANNSYSEMTGYPIEQILKWRVEDTVQLIHPDFREFVISQGLKKMRGETNGVVTNYQYIGINRKGEEKWIDQYSKSVLYNGKPADMISMIDITERKQTEKELQDREQRFRDLTESTSDWVWETDRKGVYTYSSPKVKSLLGYEPNEIIGKAPFEFMPPEEAERVSDIFYKIASAQKAFNSLENINLHKNGYPVIMETSGVPIFDADGKLVGYRGIDRDITKRKQAEQSLLESENKYRLLIENLPQKIFYKDNNSVYVACNNNYAQDLNIQPDEITGKTDFDFYPSNFATKYREDDERVMHRGEIEEIEEKYIVNGQERIVQTVKTPVSDEKGNVTGLLGIFWDITEQKYLETQFQQSQKMESIGTLAGGIAHDFNNILSPIIGYSEIIIADTPKDSPVVTPLNQILKGALRARDLVKQILTFSRQTTQEIRPLKIQHILKEVLKLSRATLPTTIQIKQEIQNECGMVTADPTQVHQIVMNLVTNAFHAMEDTGGTLTVGLKEISLTPDILPELNITPGPYVCLTVADTGTGMTDETQQRLFEPYFTTKKKNKGTGLGLAVVHGIVSTYGGAIVVASEPGKGTDIKVYIPKILSETSAIPENQHTAMQTGNERILLVDDERPITEMIEAMLERLGYRVTVRNSSTETLETFRAAPDNFDMVITDMTMPNMTGDKLALEIKKIRPDIHVIICTGFSEKIREDNSSLFGIDYVLMKPIAMNALATAVRNVLDKNDRVAHYSDNCN